MEQQAPEIRVHVTPASEMRRSIDTLLLAFAADPIIRWSYSSASDYIHNFHDLVEAYAGQAYAHCTALHVEGFRGVALWLPPGVEADDHGFVRVLERTLEPEKMKTMNSVVGEVGATHPVEAYWSLPLLGVDPAHQGTGIGGALIAAMLDRIDAEARPAYIESTSPRNLSLYERYGFERRGMIVREGRPPLFPMLRRPAAGTLSGQ